MCFGHEAHFSSSVYIYHVTWCGPPFYGIQSHLNIRFIQCLFRKYTRLYDILKWMFWWFCLPLNITLQFHGAQMVVNAQLVKKFPGFYGFWKFITVVTRIHCWSLSWNTWIQARLLHRNLLLLLLLLLLLFSSRRVWKGFRQSRGKCLLQGW
jgi:hypothetical protein